MKGIWSLCVFRTNSSLCRLFTSACLTGINKRKSAATQRTIPHRKVLFLHFILLSSSVYSLSLLNELNQQGSLPHPLEYHHLSYQLICFGQWDTCYYYTA